MIANAVQHRRAWGKTDRATGETHLLVHHCADVAAVFEWLLGETHFRQVATRLAERDLTQADTARLTALAFLHDVGKLHPEFQKKGWPGYSGTGVSHLDAGWMIFNSAERTPSHPLHAVARAIMEWTVPPRSEIAMILSHHGRPVAKPRGAQRPWSASQAYDWRGEAEEFAACLTGWIPEAFVDAPPLPNAPAFQHFVAGLLALADWIGSDSGFFPFRTERDAGYFRFARRKAADVLPEIGFGRLPSRTPDFQALTGFAGPNAAQRAVGDTAVDEPLVILEAETGSGKTEAALLRFVHLLAAGKVDALYFAVPTRAAARQLHARVQTAAERYFGPDAPDVVLAIPGMIRAGDANGWRAPGWEVRWDDDVAHRTRWASEHASRYLAARIAVGTVDQAMLSALQVGHAHARGSALSRALLVIDEVHASDAYMTAILRPLVTQHLAAGGHALLMSATLGTRARIGWTGGDIPGRSEAVALPYPAIWTGDRVSAPGGAGNPKSVTPELLGDWDAKRYATLAIEAAARGARVLVIRNMVDSAVACFRAVRAAGGEGLLMQVAEQGALHHARFAVEDRARLDAAAEAALAPDPHRAAGGRIVIGSQTLEQSLDIDADLLITDLCPVDVLLQRVGRLHRHRALPRPPGFDRARVLVGQPEGGLDRFAAPYFENGLGAWETDGWKGIYTDLAAIELTRRLIEAHPRWNIPAMNRMLVEGATHPDPVAALIAEKGALWQSYQQKHIGTEAAARMMAETGVLDRSERFDRAPFKGRDETVMTRLGEDGAILELSDGSVGAFGAPVSRIAIPARWSNGIEGDQADLRDGVLSVGESRFSYGIEGLGKVET